MKVKMQDIKNNEHSICATCNGKCCRHHSCEVHPEQVFGNEKPTIEKLIEFLSCGKYQIDWWEGDIREKYGIVSNDNSHRYESYYIRPTHTNSPNTLYDPAWNGCCVFFVDGKGCELDFEHRPYGGKILPPREDMKCVSSYTKSECCRDWSYFHDLFLELRKYDYEYLANGTIKFTKK